MPSPPEPTFASLRIVLTYVALAAIWILASDLAVSIMFNESTTGVIVSVAKGLAFVALTAVLLYSLISRKISAMTSAHQQEVASEHDHVLEAAEQARRLRHANRLYAVLSAVNRTITRKPERTVLVQDICRILVDAGNFQMAWFGVPDSSGWVTVEASCGDRLGYLKGIRVSSLDIPEGRGPTGRAIRENRPIICNDIPANPSMQPWRDRAAENGFNASAAFPVELPGGGIAALTLYSSERDFFSTAEEHLLAEISADIGYAFAFAASEEQRKSAREELERERSFLKTLVRTIPDLVWLKDPDGVYLACNPTFERFFGAPEAEIVGKNDYDFMAADLAEFFRGKDREATSAGRPTKNDEWLTFADDGHRVLVETIKTPMFGSSGELIGVLGIARDITSLRRAEEALRERVSLQEQLEHIARTAPGAIYSFRLSPDGGVSLPYGSPAFEEIWEISPSLLREDAGEVLTRLHPDDRAYVEESIEKSAREMSPWHAEFRVRRPGRGDIWVSGASVPLREPDGSTLWNGFIHDITELKLARDTISASEERFRSLTNAAADAIILLDDDGNVTFWNPAAERIFGYRASEILGESLHLQVAPPRYHEAYLSARQRFADTGEGNAVNRTLELAGLRKNGEEFPVELSVSSFKIGGRWFAAGILRDITQRKQTEEALRHAKEAAEAANRAKSRFLANMSHELRTPLNGVLGMVQLAQFGELDEQQKGYLELALTSGFGLVRILDDILDLSKIEAGLLTLDLKPFSLSECVADAASLLMPEAVRRGLQLTVTRAEDLPETVTGDQVRLRQVLTNLIGNAVKFTHQGSVTVRVTADGDGITFAVTDTGIGIPEDKKGLIFQRFSQVDDSDTRRYGGTGLGLAISREIVELMGGTIECTSTEGVGSSFFFSIPFAERRSAPLAAPPQPHSAPPTEEERVSPPATRVPRVLVVEDEPTNRALMQLALRRQHMETDTAIHGREAVEKWSQGDYDLIIMDIQMPVMDGITATRTIREEERVRGGHIPILAMTAHAYSTDEEWCLNAGMDGYLSKPVDLNDVITLVGKLLAGRAPETAAGSVPGPLPTGETDRNLP